MNNLKGIEKKYNKKILVCTVVMTFMVCLDSSIVNVALPIISRDLKASMAEVTWIVNSYLLTISVLVLLCGRIGDIKGKFKVFKVGIIIFILGSICSGLSKELTLLIVSRVIQGVGASCTMAVSMGIITSIFKEGEGRGRALGISGGAVALGTMIGPSIGGVLTAIRWDLIFWINVPIGIINLIVVNKVFKEEKKITEEKIDLRGTIAFGAFIVALTLAVTKGEFIGYKNKITIALFLLSIIGFIIFIYLQKTVKYPILDLNLFKNGLFKTSIISNFLTFIGLSSVTIILPFYLQDVLKMNPLESGFFLMIYPLVLGVTSPISGKLSDKLNPFIITNIGSIILTLGLLLLGTVKLDTPLYLVGIYSGIIGFGNGLFKSPNNGLVMKDIKRVELGIAGSVNSLLRNVGMVFGITISTTLLYDRMSTMLGYRVSSYVNGRSDVFINAMDTVFLTTGLVCFISVIVSFIRYKKYSK